LATAVDLYRGEFLQDTSLDDSPEFELWLLNQRSRYQRLYERGLEALVAQLIAQQAIEPAILRTQELIRSNPLGEDAYARLMWLYARQGQRAAALAQFEQCRKILQRELGVEPGPKLRALRKEIDAGQLGLPRPLQGITVELPALVQNQGDFVGRTVEMAQLRQTWTELRQSYNRVVLVEAEAGMGKTRLVHEFAQTTPGATFLTGECYESTHALAYAPWREMLDARLAQVDDASLRRLSSFAVDYLARLSPAFARRLRRREPPLAPTSGGELDRLFAAVAEFLLELPGAPPLILFVDNLQWADEASLQLFCLLARRRSPAKALLVGAFRTEEVDHTPALQALLGDLQRQPLVRLYLAPLTAPAVNDLTARLWPGLPQGYRPYVGAMLTKATGGNPLFISEVVRELAHTAEVPAALPVPKSVQELIQRRLNQLPEISRQVVEAMAVLEAPATPAQVQEVSGRSEEEVITAMDLALQRGLLQPQTETGAGRYGFSHDMMREAVIGQLTHVRRQLLHRRAALTLERAGAPAATLAYHWSGAGDYAKEVHYAVLAGEQAAAVYANDEAVRYLKRALELVDAPERRIAILYRLGDVLQLLGRRQEAESIYRQTLLSAEALVDLSTQARCQVALGRLMRLRGDYPQALAWLEKAETAYRSLGDQKGLAQTLWGMGAVYWSQLDYPRALTCFQQQLDIARRLGDQQTIGAAIGSMGVVYTEQGNYAQALDCYTRRLEIDMALDDRLSLAKTIGNMGTLYAEQGEYARALTCYHSLLQRMLEFGDRQNVCVAVGNMIEVYTALEQVEVAERLAQAAIALGRLLEIPLYLCEYLHTGAKLYILQGRTSEARVLNDEAVQMAAQIGRTDLQLPARLLSVRLRVLVGATGAGEAMQELADLLGEWPEEPQQAAILYELWRLDRGAVHHRRRAAELYRRLYSTIPNITCRQRYEELTGEVLPAPPALPKLPESVRVETLDLDALLIQVEQIIAG
jgi:tetratricopeptide (TPR) repeat protein